MNDITRIGFESFERVELQREFHDKVDYLIECDVLSCNVWTNLAPHERYDAVHELEGRLAEVQNRLPREINFFENESTIHGEISLPREVLYQPDEWSKVIEAVMKTSTMSSLLEGDRMLVDKLKDLTKHLDISTYTDGVGVNVVENFTKNLGLYRESEQKSGWNGYVTPESSESEFSKYSAEISRLWGLPPTEVKVSSDSGVSPAHCVLGETMYTHDDMLVMEKPFASEIAKRYGNSAVFGSLAHEVCHSLHYLDKQGPTQEIIADMGAAISMVKMGVDPLPRINAFLDPSFQYYKGSDVHPSGPDRAIASMHAAEVALMHPDLPCMEVLEKAYEDLMPFDNIQDYINHKNIDVYHTYEVFKPFFKNGMDDTIRMMNLNNFSK